MFGSILVDILKPPQVVKQTDVKEPTDYSLVIVGVVVVICVTVIIAVLLKRK